MRKVIRRIYKGWRYCLPETGLPRFPGLVPPMSEHIPKVHVGMIPDVQVGTQAGFERHMDSSRRENR